MILDDRSRKPRLVLAATYAFFLSMFVLNTVAEANSNAGNIIQIRTETKDKLHKKTKKTAINYQKNEIYVCPTTPNSTLLLSLINESRSSAHPCGGQKNTTSRPLIANCALTKVALSHAQEMEQRDVLSHVSRDGSSIRDRAKKFNVSWTALGENVASGHLEAAPVHQSWMNSPAHCNNMLNSVYTDVGIGQSGGYWSIVFSANER